MIQLSSSFFDLFLIDYILIVNYYFRDFLFVLHRFLIFVSFVKNMVGIFHRK
jgi:hypothetical protein